jgi:hypothetical protein
MLTAPASVAATVITSVSRFLTCASSSASTPATSDRSSRRGKPSVTATAARCGLRPVANTFSTSSEMM